MTSSHACDVIKPIHTYFVEFLEFNDLFVFKRVCKTFYYIVEELTEPFEIFHSLKDHKKRFNPLNRSYWYNTPEEILLYVFEHVKYPVHQYILAGYLQKFVLYRELSDVEVNNIRNHSLYYDILKLIVKYIYVGHNIQYLLTVLVRSNEFIAAAYLIYKQHDDKIHNIQSIFNGELKRIYNKMIDLMNNTVDINEIYTSHEWTLQSSHQTFSKTITLLVFIDTTYKYDWYLDEIIEADFKQIFETYIQRILTIPSSWDVIFHKKTKKMIWSQHTQDELFEFDSYIFGKPTLVIYNEKPYYYIDTLDPHRFSI